MNANQITIAAVMAKYPTLNVEEVLLECLIQAEDDILNLKKDAKDLESIRVEMAKKYAEIIKRTKQVWQMEFDDQEEAMEGLQSDLNLAHDIATELRNISAQKNDEIRRLKDIIVNTTELRMPQKVHPAPNLYVHNPVSGYTTASNPKNPLAGVVVNQDNNCGANANVKASEQEWKFAKGTIDSSKAESSNKEPSDHGMDGLLKILDGIFGYGGRKDHDSPVK